VYAPYEGLQFLAYANAPAPTTVDFIEKNWVKSGRDVSIRSTVNIRSISGFKFPNNIGSTSVKKQYEIENPENQKNTPPNMFDDVKDGKYSRAKLYVIKNELSNMDVNDFLRYADDKEKMAIILGPDNINKLDNENIYNMLLDAPDKDEMINFIIKYKTELSGEDVHNLLLHADDKEEILKILGPDNIDKLTYGSVDFLLSYADNKGQMARILGQENIDKLTDDNVYYLLYFAKNKDEIAEILGQANINKLTGLNVSDLLNYASDKEKMAKILRQNNIDKLSGDNVLNLLYSAADTEEMAEILGKENINKLDDRDVDRLILLASNKYKIAKVLDIKKLSDDNISTLIFNASNRYEMAELIINEKPELSKRNIRDLRRGLGTVKANNLINHKEEEKEENPIVKFRRPSGKYKHKLEWIDNFLT